MAHVQRFDHVGVTVADLDAATALFVGTYEHSVRMAYVRGPEGIIVSLFEQLG